MLQPTSTQFKRIRSAVMCGLRGFEHGATKILTFYFDTFYVHDPAMEQSLRHGTCLIRDVRNEVERLRYFKVPAG